MMQKFMELVVKQWKLSLELLLLLLLLIVVVVVTIFLAFSCIPIVPAR
jgi:hypothetical protein